MNDSPRAVTANASVTGRPLRRGRFIVAMASAVLVLAVVIAAVTGWTDRRTDSAAGAPSDFATAKRLSFKITTVASGRLEARRQIEIRSKLDGRSNIVELVSEGKSVKAGDVLLRLDTDEVSKAVREEQLAVETARSEAIAADNGFDIQINENQSKMRQAESKVKLAELALQQWQEGEVQKKKQELELAIEKTSRDLERLKEKVETSAKLLEKGFLSRDEYKRDDISYTEARSAAKNARLDEQIYWLYKHPEEKETKTSALEESRSELDRVKMNNQIELTSKEAARTNKRKQLEIREAQLKDLQKQAEEAAIRAPVDGLVVYAFSMGLGWRETPLQIGQPVYRNELVMVLPDTSEMLAGVGLHESLSGKVKEGQAVSIKVEAAGGRVFPGIVESLSVLAEADGTHDTETREYKVKVALDAAAIKGVELKPSMRVDATITLGEVADAVALPVQAIFNDGGLRYVYERRGGSLVRSPIKVGRMSASYAEVTAGLAEGAVVLVREPRGGEIDERPWDPAALATVGFELDSEARPVPRAEPAAGATAVCAGTDPAVVESRVPSHVSGG